MIMIRFTRRGAVVVDPRPGQPRGWHRGRQLQPDVGPGAGGPRARQIRLQPAGDWAEELENPLNRDRIKISLFIVGRFSSL